jgi:hypothetical protein
MAYGAIKHKRRKVAKALARGAPRGEAAHITIHAYIGRGLKVDQLTRPYRGSNITIPHVRAGHGQFSARVCIGKGISRRGDSPTAAKYEKRCVREYGASPTVALRKALHKLARTKIK